MAAAFRQVITTHASGNDGLYVADWQQSPFGLTYTVEVPGGVTASFIVYWTLDDLNDATATPLWIADAINGTAKVASVGGTYGPAPIRALRVSVSSLSGGVAHIVFSVIQGSSAR